MLKISIISPNYNYAHFIGHTIKSVVEQNYKNIEYIIVDDGSTDNSVEIIASFAKQYPTIIKFYPRTNHGLPKTLNFGFQQATGEIIGWLNSDDTLCEGTLNKVMAVFNSAPETDIVYGNYNLMDESGKVLFEHKHLKFNYTTGCFKGFGNILTSNAFFWKQELFNKHGYINESFRYAVDGEFFSRITWKANMVFVKQPLANYRNHGATLTSEKSAAANKIKAEETRIQFQNTYKKIWFSKYIPVKYAKFAGMFYLLKRIMLRALNGHYIGQK